MLSGLLSWKTKKKRDAVSASTQVSERCRCHNFKFELHGLEILTVDDDPNRCLQRCNLPPPADDSTTTYEDEYDFDVERACIGTYGKRLVRLFPPPIPMLARTEQMRSYMPWTLSKFCDHDGRVVMKEVRLRQHGYFKASREDGKRTLRFVSADENSLVFVQNSRHEKMYDEKEMTTVVHSVTKQDASSSSSSSSSSVMSDFHSTSSMPSSESFEGDSSTDDEVNNMNIKGKSVYTPGMQNDKKMIKGDENEDEDEDESTTAFPELCNGYYTYKESSLSNDR